MKILIIIPGIMISLPFSALCAESVYLVRNGRPQALVVVADEPSPIAQYAAEELVLHVRKATGIELEIVSESNILPTGFQHHIFIGKCRAAEKAGIDVEKLSREASLVRGMNNNLFILGRESKEEDPLHRRAMHSGTLFGVYEFLENVLQVRWLWPGELGTYVPRTNQVAVPADIDAVFEPAIAIRSLSGIGFYSGYRTSEERDNYRKDYTIYLRRHRFAGPARRGSPAHSFRSWWDRYGEEHPEWFSMNEEGERDGRRGMCVSNPDLHRYIAEQYRKIDSAGTHDDAQRVWNTEGWISLGDLDSSWRPCQCEDCLAWDGQVPEEIRFGKSLYDGLGHHHTADRYGRFYQAVYEKASGYDPDVKVSGYLYWTYFFAPTAELEISKNVYGYFCPWGWDSNIIFFPTSEEALEWKKEQWLGWKDTGMSLVYRPNHWHGGYVMPHIERQGPEFFQWAYENGMTGFHFDALYDHWSPHSETLYLYMRLFAEPDREIDNIIAEYYEAFGPAAEHVRDYFDYWEEYTRERPGGDLRWPPRAAHAYPAEVFEPAEEMLRKGLEAARRHPRNEYARRVHFLMTGLEHARLASRFWSTMDNVGRYSAHIPENPEDRRRTVEAWKELQEFRYRHRNSYAVHFAMARDQPSRGERRAIRPDLETLKQEMEMLREEKVE